MEVRMSVIWLCAMLALGFLEAVTTQLVTIWFALGALGALIASLLHAPVWLQILLFVVLSAAALILTRPLARRLTGKRQVRTNADRAIGQEGVVEQTIDNRQAQGLVKTEGAVWSARAADDGTIIPEGTVVTVERIEGVKLIVIPKSTKED